MDPVTHGVVGYALSRLAPRHATVRGAGLAGVLGALAPDIDCGVMPFGWDRYLALHELGTHSLLGAMVVGGIGGALAVFRHRDAPLPTLVMAGVAGAWSHVALDLVSGATIRVGWPMIDYRVSNFGSVAMGDPLFVVPCATALLLCVWRRAERRLISVLLLCSLATVVAIKTTAQRQALALYTTAIGNQPAALVHAPLIEPVFGSWSTWRVFDEDAVNVRAWTIDVSDGSVQQQLHIPRATADGNDAAARTIATSTTWSTVQNFSRAHDFTFVMVEQRAAGARIWWSDVRYCVRGSDSGLRCAVRAGGDLSASGRLERELVSVGEWLQER